MSGNGLNLPCKIASGKYVAFELRGSVVELTNTSALVVLQSDGANTLFPAGAEVEIEVLLPETSLPIRKCIRAKATVRRSTRVAAEQQLLVCDLAKPNFKDCDDAEWLGNTRSRTAWMM